MDKNVEEQGIVGAGGGAVLSLTDNLRINCGKRVKFGTHCILRCNKYQVPTERKQIQIYIELEIKIWKSLMHTA